MKKLIPVLLLALSLPIFGQDSKPTSQPVKVVPVSYTTDIGQKLTCAVRDIDENGNTITLLNVATIKSISTDSLQLQIDVLKGDEILGSLASEWKSVPDFIKTQKIDELPNCKIELNKVFTVSSKIIDCIVVTVDLLDGRKRELWIAIKDKATAFPGIVWVKEITKDGTVDLAKLIKIEQPVDK